MDGGLTPPGNTALWSGPAPVITTYLIRLIMEEGLMEMAALMSPIGATEELIHTLEG